MSDLIGKWMLVFQMRVGQDSQLRVVSMHDTEEEARQAAHTAALRSVCDIRASAGEKASDAITRELYRYVVAQVSADLRFVAVVSMVPVDWEEPEADPDRA